jgi:hypothetical protein
MTPYCLYQLCEAERIRTRAEVIAADARLGEIAASASRLRRNLARLVFRTPAPAPAGRARNHSGPGRRRAQQPS